MITCVAIDDEPMALEIIERYCAKNDLVELKAVFLEPLKALEYLSRIKVDLIFVDINMPGMSGMQLVQNLPEGPMVIFTTAYSHYAVESYNVNAVDYLLKPVIFERFNTAITKAVNAFKNSVNHEEEPAILLKSGPQTHAVKLSDIIYLEKDSNYITVYLKDRNILIRENMNNVFSLVPASEFIRVHKSYVVALRHISMIEVHQLVVNGQKIPVGSIYRESLRKRLGMV